jgi:hypothetical protein
MKKIECRGGKATVVWGVSDKQKTSLQRLGFHLLFKIIYRKLKQPNSNGTLVVL